MLDPAYVPFSRSVAKIRSLYLHANDDFRPSSAVAQIKARVYDGTEENGILSGERDSVVAIAELLSVI